LWGAFVVSTVDNIIKPYVLQGQSKLHPLLALLSILGGVGALGPIGVFVGPIAVAFLQAALTMLQTELDTLSDQTPGEESNSLAEK
jgi:predicted PurR-regulated permease PerM